MTFNVFRRSDCFERTRSQRVFTLIELVIALAVIGVAVGGVLFFQSSAEGRRKALAAAQGMSVLVGKVKSSGSQSGSYAHLTLANFVGGGALSDGHGLPVVQTCWIHGAIR